jgi:hypothetical protein
MPTSTAATEGATTTDHGGYTDVLLNVFACGKRAAAIAACRCRPMPLALRGKYAYFRCCAQAQQRRGWMSSTPAWSRISTTSSTLARFKP